MDRILITTSSFDVESNHALQTLRRAGIEVQMNPHGRRLTESEVTELLGADVRGMIAGVEPLTRTVLTKAEGLKVISRCGIGLDSVDLAAADELGIKVSNTPDAPVTAVAELTVALILDLLRHVAQADRIIRQGQWKQIMGNLLAFQTVGIIGYGRIGRRVGELLRAFGATLLVHDKLEVDVPAYAARCSLGELLRRSDIVTLHVPFEPGLHHFLGQKELSSMKSGAILVNTARGGLIDEQALYSALAAGHLAGVALDTYESEPYVGPLSKLPQAVLTAHMGSYARESRILMEQEAARNLVMGLVVAGIVSPHDARLQTAGGQHV